MSSDRGGQDDHFLDREELDFKVASTLFLTLLQVLFLVPLCPQLREKTSSRETLARDH
jgi:hypothetical protein